MIHDPLPQRALVRLRCGTLCLEVERADLPLDELCGYGSRRSRKRGFVFVSKVLGKHYPVRPRLMAQIYTRLATKLGELPGPAILVALAETATGLGHGVYEAWLRLTGRQNALFLHTTRYHLARPAALTFEESHSHATLHLLYAPAEPDHARLLHQARTLVLVDDELSTGQTLANLAMGFRRLNPHLTSVHWVCLTDWLGAAHRHELNSRIGLPTAFHSLLRGRFIFEEDDSFDPGPIPDVNGRRDCKDAILPANYGRLGLVGALDLNLDAKLRAAKVEPGQRLLVLGTGEFSYPPYLLACRLDELGWDVQYQATTRSPLLVDGDIMSSLEFVDNYHDQMPNYVYNVADRRYDKIVICYETLPLPAAHTLPATLGATPVFFSDGARTAP